MSKLPFTIAENARFGFRANAPELQVTKKKSRFGMTVLFASVFAFAMGAAYAKADEMKFDLVVYSGHNAYVLDTGMTEYDCNEVPVAAYINEFGATVEIKATDILRCEIAE